MHELKKKLSDESGMSILVALLAVLVALMVSVTVIAAANTTMQRVANDRAAEQQRLTLESAARVVGSEMSKTTLVETKVVTKSTGDVNYTYVPTGTFGSEMQDAISHVNTFNTKYNSGKTSISVSSPTSDVMKDVEATYYLSAATDESAGMYKYYCLFTLSLDSGSITLKMKGNYSQNVTESSTATTTVTTYTWDTPIVSSL